MTLEDKREIQREIELAKMMSSDLEKLWKSYAKKAQAAKEERELRQEKKGFLEYETVQELIDGYGWGCIDEETYKRGLEYFENLKKPPERSIVETHRSRIKELVNRYKGTVIELEEELHPSEKKHEENAFEKREREIREERVSAMKLADAIDDLMNRKVDDDDE